MLLDFEEWRTWNRMDILGRRRGTKRKEKTCLKGSQAHYNIVSFGGRENVISIVKCEYCYHEVRF